MQRIDRIYSTKGFTVDKVYRKKLVSIHTLLVTE